MRRRANFLVVEPAARDLEQVAKWIATRFDATVVSATTVEDALAAASTRPVDCVILSSRVEPLDASAFDAPTVLLCLEASELEAALDAGFAYAVLRERLVEVDVFLSVRNLIDTVGTGGRPGVSLGRRDDAGPNRDTDPVTGLATRTRFRSHLVRAIERADVAAVHGVLLVGLDGFKAINSSFGHASGDEVLRQVSRRLARCVRSADGVARWGSDEFAILLENMSSTDDPVMVAQRVIYSLGRPFECDGREVYVTASVGIAVVPADGPDEGTVLQRADAAMFRVKSSGGNQFQFYSAESDVGMVKRIVTEGRLRTALKQGEFFLAYQPQIDARDGSIVGLEALLRWNDPDNGVVSPAEFVPILEETGLIVPVGEWVLRKACTQTKAWHYAGLSHLRVSVNLSPRQFRHRALVERARIILEETGFPPASLEIEVTESALMEDHRYAIEVLSSLKQLGARIAVDDFGTGYSSLVFLKEFPVDTLKVDRAFIRNITESQADRSICSAIIALAKALGLRVLAEGVETREQVEVLRQEGCHLIQGFLFARPMPTDDLWQWLNTDMSATLVQTCRA